MAYSPELIAALLAQTDIVDVIKAYIPVTKKGRNYMALCPFHDDKHPSLSISPERQIFKCFVCGTAGNAITFVSKYEKISYNEAVRKVADIVGFHDERLLKEAFVPKKDPTIEPLYNCINDLQKFYEYDLNIPEGKIAKDYLAKRNIDDAQVKKYKIGYSLSDGRKTIEFLLAHGHSLKSIEDIGIALASANAKDANAGRLIFPLCDPNGQVVGFSARKLSEEQNPKYVNSPETPIFHKGKILYNYHNVKGSARHDGYVYVLEGFMDVMALDKAGISSAVALMGTALSADQIALLRKLNCEIRLCLDGDNAGQIGMMKIITQLNAAGLPYRLVSNPKDLRDPDDILQESGPEALKEAMSHLVDAMDFQINYYLNVKKLETPEERRKVMLYFIKFLRNVPAGIDRDNYIAKLSKATGYEAEAIRIQINKKVISKEDEEETSIAVDELDFSRLHPEKLIEKRLLRAERQALYYMLNEMKAVKYFEDEVGNFYTSVYNSIANYIVDYQESRKESVTLPLLINDIENASDEEADTLIGRITEISSERYYPPYSDQGMQEVIKVIKDEKDRLYDCEQTAKAIKNPTTDPRKAGAALKDFAARQRERLNRNKKN